jgi:hypothetical protein
LIRLRQAFAGRTRDARRFATNLRLTAEIEKYSLFEGCSDREEVLTDILAVRINDAAGKHEKGLEMQSTMMTSVRQRGCASKTFNGMACARNGLAGFAFTASPASAFFSGADSSLQQQLKQNSPVTEPSRTQGFWDVCP